MAPKNPTVETVVSSTPVTPAAPAKTETYPGFILAINPADTGSGNQTWFQWYRLSGVRTVTHNGKTVHVLTGERVVGNVNLPDGTNKPTLMCGKKSGTDNVWKTFAVNGPQTVAGIDGFDS